MSKYVYFLPVLVLLILQSCQRKEEVGINPYDGAKVPFGINFLSDRTDPEIGLPGELIQVRVSGLKQYENQFDFRLNEVSAEVVALTDSTLDFRIPDEVSSGLISIVLNDQFFTGPWVSVEGKVAVDTDYSIVNGFDMSVAQILPTSGGNLIVGSFTNFEDEATKGTPINGIHFLNSMGKSGTMSFGNGAIGSISSIARLGNGQYVVGGYVTEYNKRDVGGIARLNANGSLDTTVVAVINPDPETKPLNGLDTVSAFNGGFVGGVSKVFAAEDDGVYVVGSFQTHYRIDYSYSSRESRRNVYSNVRNVARLRYDGTLDSSFNYNNAGLNGFINDAVKLNDGRLVIVGSFTSYNGKPVRNIVCIKPNGEVDEAFTASGGSNREILSITYNPTLDKIAVAGNFSSYGGMSTQGVIIMDSDGTVDQSFALGNMENGVASYAYKLNNGRVFITGGFNRYNGVRRGGLLILEADGSARQEYNNMGFFSGIPQTLVETTSSLGNPAVLIGGFIFGVDGESVGNIVKIEIKD